jgi:abortive infection bacteriophage resistance protein
VLQALDRIEVSIRAVITYELAQTIGVFGHADPSNFAPTFDHAQFMSLIHTEEKRSSEAFVHHYRSKYVSEAELPIWMATELISFGALSKMYEHLTKRIRKQIARRFNQPQSVFVSWLHALTAVRNLCAHHCRLWNRELAVKPELPVAWKSAGLLNERFYVMALIIQTLLTEVAPNSQWKDRLKAHFTASPTIDLRAMHFPADWQTQPSWS